MQAEDRLQQFGSAGPHQAEQADHFAAMHANETSRTAKSSARSGCASDTPRTRSTSGPGSMADRAARAQLAADHHADDLIVRHVAKWSLGDESSVAKDGDVVGDVTSSSSLCVM